MDDQYPSHFSGNLQQYDCNVADGTRVSVVYLTADTTLCKSKISSMVRRSEVIPLYLLLQFVRLKCLCGSDSRRGQLRMRRKRQKKVLKLHVWSKRVRWPCPYSRFELVWQLRRRRHCFLERSEPQLALEGKYNKDSEVLGDLGKIPSAAAAGRYLDHAANLGLFSRIVRGRLQL